MYKLLNSKCVALSINSIINLDEVKCILNNDTYSKSNDCFKDKGYTVFFKGNEQSKLLITKEEYELLCEKLNQITISEKQRYNDIIDFYKKHKYGDEFMQAIRRMYDNK
jgi:hypothetical protein